MFDSRCSRPSDLRLPDFGRQSAAFRDQLCHSFRCRSFLAISIQHANPVCLGSILAHLPLALDPRDRNLDPDDSLHLCDYEVSRRIIHLPWHRTIALALLCEIVQLAAQPDVVLDHTWPTPHVHGRIIPRRNHLPGFSLGRVPGWRYVVLRTLEDDHAFLHGRQLSPLTIRSRQMTPDGAELRAVRVDQTWNPIGHEASGTGGDD